MNFGSPSVEYDLLRETPRKLLLDPGNMSFRRGSPNVKFPYTMQPITFLLTKAISLKAYTR